MLIKRGAWMLGVLSSCFLSAETLAPRIESSDPKPTVTESRPNELKRFNDGFSPPTRSIYPIDIETMGMVREWEKNDDGREELAWHPIGSSFYLGYCATDPSLRGTLPKFSNAEGLRFLRGDKGKVLQVQSSGYLTQVELTKLGWKISQWKVEDTASAEIKGWRIALPGRKVHASVEMEEITFEPKDFRREVVVRRSLDGFEPAIMRFLTEETAKRGQNVIEMYEGSEIRPERLVGRRTLQRIRLKGERRYQQIMTQEKADAPGNLKVISSSTEIWEVDSAGQRKSVTRDRALER